MSPHVKDGAFAAGVFVGGFTLLAAVWVTAGRFARWRRRRRWRSRG